MASQVVVPFPQIRREPEPRARTVGRPDPTVGERRRGYVRGRLETLRGVLSAVYDVLSYVHEPRLQPQRALHQLPPWPGDRTRDF